MALSTDINLPKKHKPQFPERCVRCNQDHQGNTIRLWTHTIGWWTYLLWMFGPPFSVRVPACYQCSWLIRLQRIGSLLTFVVLTFVILWFFWPYLDQFVARSFRKWVAGVLVLICLSPLFLWETFFPPSIDITAYKDSVDYEFKNESYACEFASLNLRTKQIQF